LIFEIYLFLGLKLYWSWISVGLIRVEVLPSQFFSFLFIRLEFDISMKENKCQIIGTNLYWFIFLYVRHMLNECRYDVNIQYTRWAPSENVSAHDFGGTEAIF